MRDKAIGGLPKFREEHKRSRLRHVRRWFLIHVCCYDGEICTDCGRRVSLGINTWWSARDEDWLRIVPQDGTANVLCPACFTSRAWEKGKLVYFRAVVE